MRYEEKVPGGKLVCIEIWPSSDKTVSKIKITGDFFLHPEDCITEIEKSLVGLSLDSSQLDLTKILESILTRNNAQLIGVTPEQLADLFNKAVRS